MSSLDSVKSLTRALFESQTGTPKGFAELLQKLFAATVLRTGERLIASDKDGEAIVGSRVGTVLKLNNGYFLKFRMVYLYSTDGPLTITDAVFQYQLDEVRMSKDFVFRYDYSINPQPEHPKSHLQINGTLKRPEIGAYQLPDITFPVNRPPVEAMLRLLIHDFKVIPNDRQNWEAILEHSEKAFLHYQSSKGTP